MQHAIFAEGQILVKEGDAAGGVFRLISGTVDVIRELDGHPILLGTVGAGQFLGEMSVIENQPRSATARAASEVEAEILTPTEFLDEIANSPRAARELIRRLCQRLREADDRIVSDERTIGRADGNREQNDSDAAAALPNGAYLGAKTAWLQRQLHTRCAVGERPFLVGRRPVAGEGPPRLQPDLQLDDARPFRVSRNHFVIEKSDTGYLVRDLGSALGTIVNGEAIGHHFRSDDVPLRAGENEVIAGGSDSPFVFSVFVPPP
jgi:CRP/FNR family transcriptional regulator, cyclic AMP receptor protein